MFGFFYFEFDLVTQEFTQMQQSQKNWVHNTVTAYLMLRFTQNLKTEKSPY
jgi:hypothetical protein